LLPYAPHLKGKNAEAAIRKKLHSAGFTYSIRSFASKGPIDILASNGQETIAIQVKSARKGSHLNDIEKEELLHWACIFNARPIIASKRRGKWQLLSLGPVNSGAEEDLTDSQWIDDGI
jgi:Holliday junction resolvase